MRLAAVLLVLVALTACTQNSPTPTPSPTSPSQTPAADLLTHFDLLLGEQVVIVAKESAAAVNHTDDYVAYTALLSANSADLTTLISRAFGDTAAAQFAELWNVQNGYLVDYGIAVVTHNDGKANDAIGGLNTTFVPNFARLLSTLSQLPVDPVMQLATQQVQDDKACIDDFFSSKFDAFYPDLHRAYAHTSLLGELLSSQIATDFPDKFPGDPTSDAANRRAKLNLALQEQSYLVTMASNATLNQHEAERSAALGALATNNTSIQAVVDDNRFPLAWQQEAASLVVYATNGDPSARRTASDTLVTELAAITKASRAVISNHEAAATKVVDDQRGKSKSVADDDRAAATSMEPIADSVQG
ncbi:MAG TPA: hypothetical protein VKE27_05355 [Candidatus Dormibacteraeota bacterium]|nr:hypothetical protein [Candidatus Dormibacteraeota bacterium]